MMLGYNRQKYYQQQITAFFYLSVFVTTLLFWNCTGSVTTCLKCVSINHITSSIVFVIEVYNIIHFFNTILKKSFSQFREQQEEKNSLDYI